MPTIKRYVDFASLAGFEYMMIDEGWCLRSGHGGSAPADADITQAKAEVKKIESETGDGHAVAGGADRSRTS